MRFDLVQPCRNCPFGIAETRITFACRERATEIAESAYRTGFPCHLSAVYDEREWVDGYVFGPETQSCAGAMGMFINSDYSEWPGINNDSDIAEAAAMRIDLSMCFESEEAFLDANTTGREETCDI